MTAFAGRGLNRPFTIAIVGTVLALLWQSATVHFNYQGDWTALFCAGTTNPPPPTLPPVRTFAGSSGYDGQFYRVIAHDPWIQKGYWRFMDNGRRRYQRILLPATAWLAALGQTSRIDGAYILTLLGFVTAGIWYTARWSLMRGRSAWWGLGILVLPGTLVSLDRMTVDPALYACLAAGLYYWRRRNPYGCWIAAAGSFLARDLGLVLTGAMVVAALAERSWKRAAALTTACAPGLLWYEWVAHTIPGKSAMAPRWLFREPLGIVSALVEFHRYDPVGVMRNASIRVATEMLDYGAFLGAFLGALLAAGFAVAAMRRPRFALKSPGNLENIVALGFAGVFIAVTTPSFWSEPYSPARAFTPLVALVAWRAGSKGSLWRTAPLALMTARVVWQMGPQALGILKALR